MTPPEAAARLPGDDRPALPRQLYAYDFSWRKRPILRRFLPESRIRFIRRGAALPAGATLLLWGDGPPPADVPESVRLVRLEDGFLRSVGLGADLVRPLSWVVDQTGIYFDASRPSDLERLLSYVLLPAELVERAGRLRESIVSRGLTKYNVGAGEWQRPAVARVILVPGQVETDASIRLGAPEMRTNLDLLRSVRQANPDAFVVYKPHPDVVAGLRARGRGERDARAWCDAELTDVGMAALLPQVDEVHTLTSLTGFEALLRGRKVVCYGQPFYAGWGLTEDRLPPPRRTRRLSLDELVAVALLLYPRYVGRLGGQLTTPEQALHELSGWRGEAEPSSPWLAGWRALLRLIARIRGKS